MFSLIHWEENKNVPFIVVVGKYMLMPKKY